MWIPLVISAVHPAVNQARVSTADALIERVPGELSEEDEEEDEDFTDVEVDAAMEACDGDAGMDMFPSVTAVVDMFPYATAANDGGLRRRRRCRDADAERAAGAEAARLGMGGERCVGGRWPLIEH